MFSLTDNNTTKIFYANGASWQVWNKPANARFVRFLVLGGGAGGGGGRTSAVNTATGGGGGGSSAITIAKIPAKFLPDVLYINVGLGGAGGISSTVGTAGSLSYISMQPNTTAFNILLQSGDAAPTAGNGGTSSIAGVGGTASTAWSYANFVFGELGMITVSAGQNGGAGGNQTSNGVSITPTLFVTGGAGGGGVSSGTAGSSHNGGNITGTGFLNTITGGTADSTTILNGDHGWSSFPNNLSYDPIFFTGGAGGGATNTASRPAGRGGNGNYGSGGGGGGGAYSSTGGPGGNGGDGLVIITTN